MDTGAPGQAGVLLRRAASRPPYGALITDYARLGTVRACWAIVCRHSLPGSREAKWLAPWGRAVRRVQLAFAWREHAGCPVPLLVRSLV